MITEIGLLQLGHLLCLVYWLGADLGVFYSSYFLSDDQYSSETRLVVAKILFGLDQGPRICMPLILAFGVHLASRMGFMSVPAFVPVVTWVVCLGWLAMVLTLHFRGHNAKGLTTFDYWFRVLLIGAITGIAIYTYMNQLLAGWLAAKLIIFAALVFCGLMVRRQLRPFGAAFAALAQDKATESDNATIRSSMARTRPFVVAIWIGLLVNTALGLHLF